MKLTHILSRVRSGPEEASSLEERHIPWIVTPLHEGPHEDHASSHGTAHEQEHARSNSTDSHSSARDAPVFKHRHESSTIELFYDLFFVANLATFTVNHDINNGSTFRSYLGFFSLLWVTWLATSLFDVRFACESVFNRICKAIHFGVMIGFTIGGAVFTTDNVSSNRSAFQVLAIVQMVSRLTLAIQYGQVLYFVKSYTGTYVPLGSIIAIQLVSSMVYFATFFGFKTPNDKTYYAWYIIACVEIVVCVTVSSIWRVVSFKRTHLVERIGLLTLIVTGEGILGLSKSVSYLLQSASSISSRDVGVLVSSVLLIYFIWMLYFDQIQHNRFGTIKQQIWALMHYPLHLCILFTVEGSTNLYVWSVTAPLWKRWMAVVPQAMSENGPTFSEIYPTHKYYVSYVDYQLKDLLKNFKSPKKISKYYDFYPDMALLKNVTAEFGTPEYESEVATYTVKIWAGISRAIFEAFGVKPAESKVALDDALDVEIEKLDAIGKSFETIFSYFYISAGFLLIVLAVLYTLGNKRKSGTEWITVGFRVLMGVLVILPLIAVEKGMALETLDNASANFMISPWHVIIVMLVYFIVIGFEHFVFERKLKQERRKKSGGSDYMQGDVSYKGGNYRYQQTAVTDHDS